MNGEALLSYTALDSPLVMRFFPSLTVYYGPILGKDANPKALDILLDNLNKEARRRAAVRLDIRTPFSCHTLNDLFEKNGYIRYNPGGEYSVLIDLNKDENELWKEMKNMARSCVRNAIRNNVEIKEIQDEQDLRSFYEIYLETAERRKFLPYPLNFFKAFRLKLEPKGVCKFFLSWHNGIPIAGILNTIYHGQSIPLIQASLYNFWHLHPNHLLYWHSICWSKVVANAKIFKLYHLPQFPPKAGIDYYTFKTSFGGRLIQECAFYYKIFPSFRQQFLNKLGNIQNKIGVRNIILRNTERVTGV
jgi:hypothetical protein